MTSAADISDEDGLRADAYGFLANLLVRAPDAAMLAQLAALTGNGSALGESATRIAGIAAGMSPKEAEREFNQLFIGIGRGELVPYASFYMTGFLNEKPLATLRRDMARLRIERAPDVFEPEDNIASLCEMMAGLIRGAFGAPAGLGVQRDFFNRHVAPWAGHFFRDLESAEAARLYAPVGTMGRLFMEIETSAFRMVGETAA